MEAFLKKAILSSLTFFLIHNCGQSQTFNSIIHEYDDFPNIDEIEHGDFNGDGDMDYVISGTFIGQVKVGLGNGISRPVFQDIEDDLNVFRIKVLDYDSDGDLDFVGSAPFEDESYVWLNDGSANFTRQTLPFVDYQSIHFVDIDNDGGMNIIVGGTRDIVIYDLDQGVATFNRSIYEDTFAGSVTFITAVDYTGNGINELVAAMSFDGLMILYQDSPLTFRSEELFEDATNIDEIFIEDFNEDEILDFVVHTDFGRRNSLLLSNSSSEYTSIDIPRDFGPSLFVTVADIDNNGTIEIFQTDGDLPVTTGFSFFQYDNMTSALTSTLIAEDHADTEDGGIVDIDGDGLLDLYLYTNDFFDTGIVFYIQQEPLSTHQLSDVIIDIYPNPVSDILHIDMDGHLDFTATIYSMNGQLIKEEQSTTQINTSDLQSGMYLLEIKDKASGERIIQRIIIER